MTHMEKQCSLLKDEWMNKPLALTSVTRASLNSELAVPSVKDIKVISYNVTNSSFLPLDVVEYRDLRLKYHTAITNYFL